METITNYDLFSAFAAGIGLMTILVAISLRKPWLAGTATFFFIINSLFALNII